MKTLILLRHGKAEPYDAKPDDFDRVLASRGRKNAAEMGKFIADKNGMPELMLVSEAKRAMETAVLAAENMNFPKEKIQIEAGLYLASAHRIFKYISGLPNEIDSCMLVGHNPGLTDLVNYFGVRLDNLPTASAVCFTFETEDWSGISAKNSRFLWIKLAREL